MLTGLVLGSPEGNPNLAHFSSTNLQLQSGLSWELQIELFRLQPTQANAFHNDDCVCFTIPSQLIADKK